jgi:hypothetical protein
MPQKNIPHAKIRIVKEDTQYPASEDIYNKAEKEININADAITTAKEISKKNTALKNNEKSFEEDLLGDDLDIPGSELDDEQEKIGSEDEENNYYSVGGDNHNDLEEDNR